MSRRALARQLLATLGGLRALDLNADYIASYKKTRRQKKTRLGRMLSEAKISSLEKVS